MHDLKYILVAGTHLVEEIKKKNTNVYSFFNFPLKTIRS
jgi:hypothetical protein